MFTSKVVLVTGGSSGIGRLAALMFAEKGADVAITYKSNQEGAMEVVTEIEKTGRSALAIQADLINEAEAKNVVEEVVKKFGKIDILVNNAGRYIDGDEWNGTSDIWVKSLGQNLVSVMNVSKYVFEIFEKQNSGVIINVASQIGIHGNPYSLSYGAAKAGVINLTQAYSELMKSFGRANCVSPGATEAGYWLTAPREELEEKLASRPNHKLIDPKTVAEKIVFLASDGYKDTTGQNFEINE
jgi:3-oxoacyl-[acyl-carrier protein] reductase